MDPRPRAGGCKRYCMTVEPREGPEGSVFRFEGHRWRANRRVSVIVLSARHHR